MNWKTYIWILISICFIILITLLNIKEYSRIKIYCVEGVDEWYQKNQCSVSTLIYREIGAFVLPLFLVCIFYFSDKDKENKKEYTQFECKHPDYPKWNKKEEK